MDSALSEEERRETIARFEAVGVATVQLAVNHPQSSPSIFGIGDQALLRRELAANWLEEARPRERRRRCRQEALLWVGAFGGVVAAFASVALLLVG